MKSPNNRSDNAQLDIYATKWNLQCHGIDSSCCVIGQRDPRKPANIRLLSRLLAVLRNLMKDDTCMCHQTGKSQGGPQLEASPAWTSVCGTGRYFACCWRRKVIINSTQLQMLSQQWPACKTYWYNSGTNDMVINNHFWLNFSPIPWDGTHTCHYQSGQESKAR